MRTLRLWRELDNPQKHEAADEPVRGVELEPPHREVWTHRILVMVVLEEFAQDEELNGEGISRLVTILEINVAVFVAAPVDDDAVNSPHEPMDRQEQVLPPSCRERHVKRDIYPYPKDLIRPRTAKAVEHRPFWIPPKKAVFGRSPTKCERTIGGLHPQKPSQLTYGLMRRMRIFRLITVGMMHAMQDRIRPRLEIRSAHGYESQQVEDPLPPGTHREHTMGRISMKKERLEKHGSVVVTDQKQNDGHSASFVAWVEERRTMLRSLA